LEICAAVARSHGKDGEVIARAISCINLDRLFEPVHEKPAKRLKYVYRKRVKGHEYVYFRMPNGRVFRLPEEESSAEFRKQYEHYRCNVGLFRKI
jgi:hypothetical protein